MRFDRERHSHPSMRWMDRAYSRLAGEYLLAFAFPLCLESLDYSHRVERPFPRARRVECAGLVLILAERCDAPNAF